MHHHCQCGIVILFSLPLDLVSSSISGYYFSLRLLASCSLIPIVFPSLQVALSAFDSDASLDVLDHPILNLIYYTVSIPSLGLCQFHAIENTVMFWLQISFDNSWSRFFLRCSSCTFCGSYLPKEYQHSTTQSANLQNVWYLLHYLYVELAAFLVGFPRFQLWSWWP